MNTISKPNRKLKALRVELGYNQTEMSEKTGISFSSYIRKENGFTSFTIEEVKKIKEELHLSDEQTSTIFF
ncbi:helix-turn-helix domain-containing protein [Marinilactibacillus psychrotolerans]|uniref:helix-turn-helix domain-containing protein n=1 Tax=Marinilactibacillus psychrotolerans TaxID=191770 RepID=UPI0038871801